MQNKYQLTAFVLFVVAFMLLADFAFGKVVINEIMYNLEGTDTGREWVEVLNRGPEIITIVSGRNGFRFFDGSNHLINEPTQGNLTLNPGDFLILSNDPTKFLQDNLGFSGNLTKSAFSLGNDSEILKLIDTNGIVLDEISYNSNLGASGNGKTLGLVNNSLQETNPTTGKINEITPPNPLSTFTQIATQTPPSSTIPKTSSTIVVYPNTVIINEFIPNPEGNDSENEWVELYNSGNEVVDISSWLIKNGVSKIFMLSGKIPAQGFIVVHRTESKIAITNDGDEISLLFPNGAVAFSIKYSGNAPTGQSFARFGEGDWRWTSQPTPGRQNVYAEKSGSSNTESILNTARNSTATVDIDALQEKPLDNTPGKPNLLLFVILGIILGVISAIVVIKTTKPL